jgi:hypothetical protein
MDWRAPLDLYCERLGPGFWAEPFNALTNPAFIVAAVFAVASLRRSRRSDPVAFALALLVGVIGVGSFLFHTLANRWSVLADVLPITFFIYAYLALAMRRFLALGWPATVTVLILFFAASWAVEGLLRPLLSGSAGYVPALAAILIVGILLRSYGHPAARLLLAAGAIFAVSLVLRTLDQPLCTAWPIGTHFLWHLLNAATLALLLSAAIRHRNRA